MTYFIFLLTMHLIPVIKSTQLSVHTIDSLTLFNKNASASQSEFSLRLDIVHPQGSLTSAQVPLSLTLGAEG